MAGKRNSGPIVVDCFAGGGGASMGIELALGRPVDEAINHDPLAVAMHQANHPSTRHWTQDIHDVRPEHVAKGRPIGLAWFSPDCKHFSRAKGGKPVEKRIRDLAWVVVDWARAVRPAVICLENVSEFADWGPLDEHNLPIKERRGETFAEWVSQLRSLGYDVDWRELKACDYGAPTLRRRLFLVARCDGRPIRWPEETHGRGLEPYRTAAECIDWSIPCPSIFLTPEEARLYGVRRPLAEATMRRIAAGVKRYVIEAERPFYVALTHHGPDRVYSVDDPFVTITAAHRGELSLVAPTLVQTGYGERDGQAPRAPGLDKPLGTVVAGGTKHALVAGFLAKHYGGVVGTEATEPMPTILSKAAQINVVAAHLAKHYGNPTGTPRPGAPADVPLPTILSSGAQTQLVTSSLVKLYGTNNGASVEDPLPTVTATGQHLGEVRAFLAAYYGSERDGQALTEPLRTVPTRDRFGLVTVHGQAFEIVDIGMRMLEPKELFAAQGFPSEYIISPLVSVVRREDGTFAPRKKPVPMPDTEQIRMAGNAVCPDVARALVAANVQFDRQPEMWRGYELAGTHRGIREMEAAR